MKKIFIFTAFFTICSILSYSQYVEQNCNKVDYRDYKDSTGFYKVRYEYNDCYAMIPATYPPGEPHYDARITVFKISVNKKDTIQKQVGKSFMGSYIVNGCFEDRPEYLVSEAKRLQMEATKNN